MWSLESTGKQLCSTCGTKLPTKEEIGDVYLRHWFYGFVYQEPRPIFDTKASVYDVVAKLVLRNETGCDPRLERTVEVQMGESKGDECIISQYRWNCMGKPENTAETRIIGTADYLDGVV